MTKLFIFGYFNIINQCYNPFDLSEEASLQCTRIYAPGKRVNDCNGGYFKDTLVFFQKVGSVLESKYPYVSGYWISGEQQQSTPGICSQRQRIYIGNGTTKVYQFLTIEQIKSLLFTQGPLMVAFYANNAFMRYSSGIFTGCPSYSAYYTNHVVLLVGYNDASRYWLVKNQYGSFWGQNGYMRVSYDSDCGLSSLLGNIKFTSYVNNPQVTFTQNLQVPTGAPSPISVTTTTTTTSEIYYFINLLLVIAFYLLH